MAVRPTIGTRVKIIGGPFEQALGKIGRVVGGDVWRRHRADSKTAYWVEFTNVVFEGADPETQYPNRSWFFVKEIEVVQND